MLLFVTGQVFAGAPTWTRVDYTNSTTFVGIVKIIQYTPTFGYTPVAGDYIGAFVGTECRMVAQIFANGSDLYVSSVIQGGDNCVPNEPNCTAGGSEKVTFKLWSNTGSKEYAPIKGDTLTYPGNNIGSTTPYEIGKGKTGKDLLTLIVPGATLSPAFASGTTSYSSTVSTIPVIVPSNYTYSPNATVTVSNATDLNGTLAQRTTTITVTSESGYSKIYTIVYSSSCTAPTLVITPSATSICIGGTTTLTASGASTYTWSNNATTAAITVSPTANITYTVTGTSATGGCTATITQAIVVNALPTVNAGTDASACINTPLNLNATITGGNATYTYTWSPTTNLSYSNIEDPSYNSAIAGATTYTLSVTDANGCKGSDVVIITANGIPTVTATANPATICKGISTTITAAGATSYIWSSTATTTSITVTPSVTTAYSVTGTNSFGCKNTAIANVTVNQSPSILASASPTSICIGNPTTVSASGAVSYIWNPATVGTINPTATTTYSVTGTDANGCKGTSSTVVIVNQLPNITASATPATICKGESSTITSTGAVSYLWNTTDNTTSIIETPTITSIYSITGTDANGCKNTASATVTVNNLPTVQATASASSICVGKSTIVGATGAVSYLWNPTTVGTINPTSTTIYSVTGTDANGCKGTSSTTVTVNQLPTLLVSATPASICIGSTSALSVSGAISYIWDNQLSSGANQIVTPTIANTYNVTGTDANGCTNTNKVAILVNNLPTISLSPSTVAICNGSSTTLTANGGISYSWDNALVSGTSKTVSPSVNTTYNVIGTDGNGCKNSAQSIVTVTTPELPVSDGDKSILVNETIPALSAQGTSIKWYSGTTLLTAVPSLTYTPNVDKTIPGVYPYKVTNTVNGCESAPIIITFTISSCTVTAPTVDKTSQEVCLGAAFAPFTTTGSSVKWYNSKGDLLTSTNGVFIPTAAGDYYTSQTVGCEGPKTKVSAIENPLPLVSASANPASICIGNSTTILALGASTYEWNNSAGTNGSKIISPTSTTTYIVTGTDLKGCKNTGSVIVVVNSLPTVTISTNPTSICNGSSSVITTNGAVNYTWDNAINNVVSTINPSTTTTYTVKGTDMNGCIGTSSTTLTVNSLPTVTANASPLAICIGETSTVSVIGASTYIWDKNVTGTSSSVNPTGTTVYSVTGTDNNGCKANSSITVTVNSLPTIVAISNPSAICNGDAAAISAKGATSFTWDNAVGTVISKIVSPITSTTYNVTGTDANGCKNIAQTIVTVTTPALPSITAGTTTYTINQTITELTVTGTSVNWYNNAGTLLSVVPTNKYTPIIDNSFANSIIIKATNTENGCTSASVPVTITVTNCSVAAPTLDKTTQSICTGGTFTAFTATGTSVKWYDASDNTLIPTTAGVFTPTKAGSYYATQTNICEGVSASVTAIENVLPSITATSTKSAICNGNGTTISVQGASSYIWDNNVGSNSSTVVSPSVSTTYNVTGTDANGCKNIAQTIVTVTTPALPSITAGTTTYTINQTITELTVTGTSVNWYNNAGTLLSVVPTNKYTPIIDNSFANSIIIKATNTENGCTSASVPVTITVTNCSVAAPTLDKTTQSICTGGTFTAFTATGTSVKWYDASDNTLIPTTAGVFTPTKAGSYYATQTNICEGARANVTAVENTLPNVSIAKVADLCLLDNSITLTASPSGGSFVGTGITGNGVFTPSTSGNFTITYNYTDSKSCSNSSSTIIKVNALPTVTAAAAKSAICLGTSTTISVTGASSYIWDNSIGNVTSATVSPIINKNYSVTGTDVNGCKNKSSVFVVVNSIPGSVSATGATACEGLSGILTVTGATGAINWYDSKSTTSIATTPSITVLEAGTYTVAQSTNGCEGPKTSVQFVVNSKPSPVTIPNVTINVGEAIPTFDAGTIVTWYDLNRVKITTAATYKPTTISNTSTSTNAFYVDVTSSSNCTSAMTTFTFEIKSQNCPSAPQVSVNPICQGETGIITAVGTNLKWYNVATGGTVLSTANTYSVSAANSYYVTQSNASCESQRAKIDVVVNAKTTLTITAPATMKTNDSPVVITVDPIGGILSGGAGLNGSVFTPSVNLLGINTINYEFTNSAGCKSTTSKIINVSDGSVDLSILIASITSTNDLVQNAILNSKIGSAVGQYPKTALDILNAAIGAAILVRDNPNSSQTDVNTANTTLQNAVTVFGNSIVKVGDKSTLTTLIQTAQGKADNSTVGSAIGNYPSSAKTDLLAAITTATAVKNDPTATQGAVDAAKTALQTAITAFEATKITAIIATGIKFPSTIGTVVDLKIGQSIKLTYELIPSNAVTPDLVWTSSNPSIVSVDQNGNVTALASSGFATITVAFKNDPTKYAKIPVNLKVDISEIDANTPLVGPTVTSDVVYIKKAGLVKSIKVIASDSKKVKDISSKADVVLLDLTDLANGTYFIILEMEDGSIITKNIIKQ